MGRLLSKPKTVKPPVVEEALPPPIEVEGSADSAAIQARARKGRKDTILTGELEPDERGGRKVLG